MNNNMIAQTVKDGLCTGCGTCIALCPEEAIKLMINEKKGIYVPELNEERCKNCGICFKVCPGHKVEFKQLNLEIFSKEPQDILVGNYLNCYIGHSTDYNIRYNSASGGLVTQLLIFALEEGIIDGALVTRMKVGKPLEPEPFIARTKEEIIEASKSKYCPVPANIALKEILKSKGNEHFAVVGLPCHIHGIRKAEMIDKKLKQKIILHLGIFCGLTCSFLGTDFLLKKLGIDKEEIKEFNYRGEGWPGSMWVRLKNGEKRSLLLTQYFGGDDNTFASFILPRCTLCVDETSELADISFGDAWLPELSGDKKGKSIIVSRNTLSEDILRRMAFKKKVEVKKISSSKVIQSQGGRNFKKNVAKAHFFIFRLCGKKLPTYYQRLPEPPFRTYQGTISFHLQMFLASKRYLWGLLKIYISLFKYAAYIKSKLKF